MQPSDGKYRVVVHARNFATNFQRYSLAISGCLRTDEPTNSPSAAPQLQVEEAVDKPSGSTKSLCPDSEIFELEMTAAAGENKMIWDLIMPSADATSETILSGPNASEYQENKTYYYSACLQPNRYRFKMLNIGDASYKMSVGGEEILNSKTLNHTSNIYTFRFRVTADGYTSIKARTRPREG
jgi:hypothetical protein